MRRTAVALATLTVTAACTSGPPLRSATDTTEHGRPAISQLAIDRLPELPAHPPERPVPAAATQHGGRSPVAVAERAVVAGLTAQRLEVLDLGAVAVAAGDDRTTVRVVATHQPPGGGRQHTSIYDLNLTLQPDGGWELVASRTVQ